MCSLTDSGIGELWREGSCPHGENACLTLIGAKHVLRGDSDERPISD